MTKPTDHLSSNSPDTNTAIAKIAFIGAGNMARSLIGGLLKQGYPASHIACSDPMEASLTSIAAMGAVSTSTCNTDTIAAADVVILAVKPQVMREVLTPLMPMLTSKKPLLISIAAGISCDSLQNWAGEGVPIVRCMPNTPALLQVGATGLYATDAVSAAQHKTADVILSAVGTVVWVKQENELDAVAQFERSFEMALYNSSARSFTKMFSFATIIGITKLTAFEVRNLAAIAYAVEQKIATDITMSRLIVKE